MYEIKPQAKQLTALYNGDDETISKNIPAIKPKRLKLQDHHDKKISISRFSFNDITGWDDAPTPLPDKPNPHHHKKKQSLAGSHSVKHIKDRKDYESFQQLQEGTEDKDNTLNSRIALKEGLDQVRREKEID